MTVEAHMLNELMVGYEVWTNVMQLIIIILGSGSSPPQTPPQTDNNYKKNESVTNDSLSTLRNLRWMSAS